MFTEPAIHPPAQEIGSAVVWSVQKDDACFVNRASEEASVLRDVVMVSGQSDLKRFQLNKAT